MASSLRAWWILVALSGCDEATPSASVTPFAACAPEGAVVERPAACETPFCGTALPSWGSAVAVGDIDGDGLPDLLLGATGPNVADLGPLVLLRNLGAMRFAPITRCAGLDGYGARVALFADLDNDGDQDLVLGGRAHGAPGERGDLLVFEQAQRHFALRRRVSANSPGAPTALDVGDLDRDGLPDLLVGRGGTDPRGRYPAGIYLGRPGLALEDRSDLIDNEGYAWIAAATDLDDDGATDALFLHDPWTTYEAPRSASDAATCADLTAPNPALDWRNTAWRNTAAPGACGTRITTFSAPFESANFNPMGVAIADFNEDGRRDYLFAHTADPALFLGRDGAAPEFASAVPGLVDLSPESLSLSAWSALARDLDRDGREDALITWGVIPPSRTRRGNTLLLGRGARGFEYRSGTGLERPDRVWSALALADFDGDGDDDVVTGAQTIYLRPCDHPGDAVLYENRSERGARHWLRLRLVGTVSSRDALGARVEVSLGAVTITRVVSGAGGTASSGDREVDLGLGALSRVPWLRIRWPSGATQRLRDLAVDRAMVIEEPRWLQTTTEGGAVQVTVSSEGLDDVDALGAVEATLRGPATWQSPLARTAAGTWRGALRAQGDALLIARVEGTTLHAARWVR